MRYAKSIQQRTREARGRWRVCDHCHRNIVGLGALCRRCRRRRGRFGTVKPHTRLDRSEWNNGADSPYAVAEKYIAEHPPPTDVIEGLRNLLAPGNPLPPTNNRATNAAYVVRQEMLWQADPRSAKKCDAEGQPYTYSDEQRLAVLLATTLWIEEREGIGFPHDSADVARATALLLMRKRPRHPAGRIGAKRSRPIPPTALHAVARRLRETEALGVYLLVGTRHIIRRRQQEQDAISKRPRKPGPPPPRIWTPPPRPSRVSLLVAKYGIQIHHS
jgi:hypothetical protein